MEQIVERKNKSVTKVFLVVIGSAILIDFAMFIMNNFIEQFPHMTSIIATLLVIISCSYILIRYLSKYLYTLEGGQLIFHRVIGKRKFEMLRIDSRDLIYIGPYDGKEGGKKHSYNFTFDKNGEQVYIGKFKGGNMITSFLFSPNEKILKELKHNKEIKVVLKN